MKLKSIIGMAAAVAAMMLCSTNKSYAGEADGYAHNDRMENGQVVSRDIFKWTDDGKYLKRYGRFDYTYDTMNRMTSRKFMRWNDSQEEYVKAYVYTYQYSDKTCCIDFSLCKYGEFEKSERYIYSSYTTSNRLFVEHQSFKWNDTKEEWVLVDKNKFLPVAISPNSPDNLLTSEVR